MQELIVLYRIDAIMSPLDPPFGFRCHADDTDHAEEQCLDAYPDCDIVWVSEARTMEGAWHDYYNNGMEN